MHEIENKIVSLARELFKQEVSKNSKLGNPSNWDSLGQLTLIMSIEQEFGVKFSIEETIQNDNIEKISNFIKNKI